MSDSRAAIIGGVIAAAGLMAGAFIDKILEMRNFAHSFETQRRNELVLKRFDLISSYSKQIYSADYLNILHQWNKTIADVGPIATQYCNDNSTNQVDSFKCLSDGVINRSLEYRNSISERNSEFLSTIRVSGLLFGPKVNAAILSIEQPLWWTTDTSKLDLILAAMRDELYYFDEGGAGE